MRHASTFLRKQSESHRKDYNWIFWGIPINFQD